MKRLNLKQIKYEFNIRLMGIFFFVALCLVFVTSCSDHRDRLPDELEITDLIYEAIEQRTSGPGGLNGSLRLYKLPIEISQKIRERGLDFLNHLPSAKNYKTNRFREQFYSTEKYWKPFKFWNRTPVSKDERWLRRSYIVAEGDDPTVGEFVGDVQQESNFMKTIDPHIEDLLHRIIRSSGSYYAYGGYHDLGILILSPEHDNAFYLFRD